MRSRRRGRELDRSNLPCWGPPSAIYKTGLGSSRLVSFSGVHSNAILLHIQEQDVRVPSRPQFYKHPQNPLRLSLLPANSQPGFLYLTASITAGNGSHAGIGGGGECVPAPVVSAETIGVDYSCASSVNTARCCAKSASAGRMPGTPRCIPDVQTCYLAPPDVALMSRSCWWWAPTQSPSLLPTLLLAWHGPGRLGTLLLPAAFENCLGAGVLCSRLGFELSPLLF